MFHQMVVAEDCPRAPVRSRERVIVLLAVSSMAMHFAGWNYVGYDVGRWLLPWYDHILYHGRIGAFAIPFSNYTPPYLYMLAAASLLDGLIPAVTIIKLLSVAGTASLAAAVYYLLGTLAVDRRGEKAACIFLVPTTLLNAPVLAQCDAMWVAACVMAVAEAVRRRRVALLVWCGVAFALKLQAIFLAPFVFSWLLAERVPLRLWLIPPSVYVAAVTPAWALGWPAGDFSLVYLRQAQYFNTLGNASNPWSFAVFLPVQQALALTWISFAAAAFAVAVYIRTFARLHLDPQRLILAALLASMLLPFFLPKMHERYFFLADILALTYAWVARDRQGVVIAISVQLTSLLALFGYIFDKPQLPMIGSALAAFVMLAVLTRVAPLSGNSQYSTSKMARA